MAAGPGPGRAGLRGGAREDVLARIRAALRGSGATGGAAGGAVPPGGGRTGDGPAAAELAGLFAERLADYGSRVRRCGAAGLGAAAAAALAERGARRVVVPPGLALPAPDGVDLIVDDGFSAAELDGFDAVITAAALAVAETGTIVLDGSAGQGRRALSLIPDYHLCLVGVGQIVGLVSDAVRVLDPRGPLTWISGPSATSDIELDRVPGVHGPRTLEVILADQEPGAAG